MTNKSEIFALTGLRFVAAFYVFVFHMQIRWPITKIKFVENFFGQGAVGMSIFFILSGFVLAYRYADGQTSFKKYLTNRFARIYPVYIVAAVLTLPWIGLSWHEDTGLAIAQGILLVFSNIFLIQSWFPQFFDYWNDGGSWSISVEIFCYLLLPFILPRLVQLPTRRLLFVGMTCYLLAVLPGLIGVLFPGSPRGVYYSMPIYRLPEFIIGTCTYLIFRDIGNNRYTSVHLAAFSGLIVVYLGFWGPKIPNYVGHNWIMVPFIAFMIFSLANGRSLIASLLTHPVSVWLGKISYCFYSFQPLVILLLISYHDKLVKIFPLFANSRFVFFIALTTLLGLSALGHYLIEEPARRKIRTIYEAS